MKKWGIFLGLFVCLVLVFAINCKSPASSEAASPFVAEEADSSSSSTSGTGSSGGVGTLTIKMTDNPVKDAEEVWVTISSIQVHYADEDEFIGLPYDEFNYDLLKLKDQPAILNVASLEAGHYNQIRMEVTKGWIIFPDDDEEEALESEPPDMKIPSSKIKIPVQFHIEAGSATQLVLDFDVEESIKVKKRGNKDSYIMSPVIKVVKVSYK